MAKFRKKPEVIEAVKVSDVWEAHNRSWNKLPQWYRDAFEQSLVSSLPDHAMSIKTLEGTTRADFGDWIIRGVKGEFYPCKPDIFAATYEAVTEGGRGD